ncbi:DUF1642 domain-containing protein [Enterococcus faecium]|uniref:DUF1642 domain-containing protein n=1 Tax=Enterococcus faecium TaxID=1352 RepID=UPI001E46FAA9|nr:DUF1642 domain-containing protein [Enterococcus faecium]MCD5041565.1 DUF1642 domain-containing protein [Enterococcus faecium]
MNKQEAIKKLESIKVIGNDAIAACYNESINAGITLMKQLDEPQKPVVPKFVAEWIEYAKKKGDSLAISFKPWNLYGVEYSKADRWIEDNQETFARAWLDGYEVEKEPLYYVPLPDTDKDSEVVYALEKKRDGNIEISLVNRRKLGVFDSTKLSEQEIKSVDERYQLFAKEIAK